MTAAASLLSSQTAGLAGKMTPMATSGTNGSDDASSDSATITANDFLTLLVTEMQNQDPTADTDPNEYINQLVQVNSLEQLIGINQTLTSAFPASTSDTNSNNPAPSITGATDGANAHASTSGALNASAAANHNHESAAALSQPSGSEAPGNLSIPGANASAERVAGALSRNTTAHPAVSAPVLP